MPDNQDLTFYIAKGAPFGGSFLADGDVFTAIGDAESDYQGLTR